MIELVKTDSLILYLSIKWFKKDSTNVVLQKNPKGQSGHPNIKLKSLEFSNKPLGSSFYMNSGGLYSG